MKPITAKPVLWRWLRRALLDWLIIIVSFYIFHICPNLFVKLLCIIVIGTRQHALSILGHDGGHRLASQNRWVNDAVTQILCLWPLMVPLQGYRNFHFSHHRNVGTDDDPELIHKKVIPQWVLPFKPLKIVFLLITDLFGGGFPHAVVLMYLTRPINVLDIAGPLMSLAILLLVCWTFNAMWIPLVWFGCFITSFWACFRLRIWSEHVGTTKTHLITANGWQKFLFLPHNTWCHYAHHENPAIPCWALPAYQNASLNVLDLFKELSQKEPTIPY